MRAPPPGLSHTLVALALALVWRPASGEPRGLGALPDLAAEGRARLAEAAEAPDLPGWQREIMLQVAGAAAGRAKASSSGESFEPWESRQDRGGDEHLQSGADGTWGELSPTGTPPSPRYRHTAIYDPVRDRMVVFGGWDDSYQARNDLWVLTLSGTPAWSRLTPSGTPPSPVQNHTAIYDPVRDRMVTFDGAAGGVVWALSLGGTPTWNQLTPSGTPPSAMYNHTAIYDPVRDRMVVFGGWDGTGYRNDVWVLTLAGTPSWNQLMPSGTPPSPRQEHSAIYDPVRDRMLVFAGWPTSSSLSDVWALSLSGTPAWTLLAPSGTPPSPRSEHSAIYDAVRDAMVVFGGRDGTTHQNEVWVLSLAEAPAWTQLMPSGVLPGPRADHTAIYDPVRDRMVVFGGLGSSSVFLNDVWLLSFPAAGPPWSQLAPTGDPPAGRRGHSSIHDPVRNRMIVFGGWDGTARQGDVWTLALTGTLSWTQLSPAAPGGAPSPRDGHSAIYDPVRDEMVVFGGNDGARRNDVWRLSLSGTPTWFPLLSIGPEPAGRLGHTAIYDPRRDRMVVFGGSGGLFANRNDVWALSLAGGGWAQLTPSDSPPTERHGHCAIYDPAGDRMVIFGGRTTGFLGSTYHADTWALSLAGAPGWVQVLPSGTPPAARHGHSAVYDPARQRMVVFGGWDDATRRHDVRGLSLAGSPVWWDLAPAHPRPSARFGHTAIYDAPAERMLMFAGDDGALRSDVWTLSLAWSPPWTEVTPAGPAPGVRYLHNSVFDLAYDRMVVFGGVDGTWRRSDAWALQGFDSPGGTYWQLLLPDGAGPSHRHSASAIYDPVRQRMIVFGGYDGTRPNDVWALSLGASPGWTRIYPSGTPPSGRSDHAAIYDPVRDRMVIFGGYDTARRNDVWALSLSGTGSPAWTELLPSGTKPGERFGHVAIYDPVRDRMIVHGGQGWSGSRYDDVWAMSLGASPAWAQMNPAGTKPQGRHYHGAIYDPPRDRMVVFAGWDGSVPNAVSNDVWGLRLSGSGGWMAISPSGTLPPARWEHSLVYDPVRDRMVAFGGRSGTLGHYADVWMLALGQPWVVSVPPTSAVVASRVELSPPRPNPFRGQTSLEFALPEGSRVSLVIYDVTGRAVRQLAAGDFPAGRHTIVWDGRDRGGRTVPTGVYFVRLEKPGFAGTRKAVMVR